ncbi:MarR family winged helix-turn-helix transcriptional regulator [Glutamicibacter sp. AOP5-A2-18]|uniref:MarR family winged helix-turn-helix transcriptional regulator n=1 Tax=Glutamicibacter sp. AOP5-A2-18 TaxID=3457656 RepID=UPI0040340DBA
MHARNDQHLVVLLQEFSQATDRYVESTGAQFGTHRTDMNALSIIMKYERSGTLPSAKDLSADLQLSAPATTAMLDRLARFELIERLRSDNDRRVIHISPTDKARTLGRQMFMPLGMKMMEVIGHYRAQELEVISRFLAEAISGVDDAREQFVTLSPTNQPNATEETSITR